MASIQLAAPVPTLVRVRQLLLVALLVGFAGTGVELVLLGHTEGWQQRLPIVLLFVSTLVVVWHAVRSGGAARSALIVLMWASVLSGAIGVGLHYQGNAEFEREMYPEMAGLELFRATMTGATPVLAPGTMALLGLVGLTYAYVSARIPGEHSRLEEES